MLMRVATGNGNLHANKGQQRLFLTGICKALGQDGFLNVVSLSKF